MIKLNPPKNRIDKVCDECKSVAKIMCNKNVTIKTDFIQKYYVSSRIYPDYDSYDDYGYDDDDNLDWL